MQAMFGQMEAIQTTIDQMLATQAQRNKQTSADEEKMVEYLEKLTAAIKRGIPDINPPAATPTKRSMSAPKWGSPTSVDTVADEDDGATDDGSIPTSAHDGGSAVVSVCGILRDVTEA